MTTTAGTPAPGPVPLSIAPAAATHHRSLSVKPLAAAPSPAPAAQCSITSKEWVVPPRPKPGRKPATDTPPTKRKAQNRAAQRAFRERRAARVGELEEQIKKIEEENEREEAALREAVQNQLQQIEEYKSQILWWKNRCKALEDELMTEKVAKEDAIKKLERTDSSDRTNGQSVIGGCERCSFTRCQCIDDAFNISNITQIQADDSHSKRGRSPSQGATQKRHRSNPEIKTEPEELETDFTTSFTLRRHPRGGSDAATPILIDPCGFCQDGSPCICAEMAEESPADRNSQSSQSNKLPSIHNISQFTPPPSEGDVLSRSATLASRNESNPCANGPGTCAQCLADPRSSVFCKSLAASRASSGQEGGCCGGGGGQGGCCKTRPSGSGSSRQPASTPITLSCADTFTTLSRHPKFSSATDELSQWLPQLHTLPNPQDLTPDRRRDQNLTNRPALEVEAASVMGVLRYFDRRFADSK
ncbi:hypothetical protein McanMca71_000965 [Microsporum canis]|uniref:BZIP transcription factor HapX n=1 Tax=Arthroderma otae (strain ATCC MYA-4605 / CBS 113480) TaxID=554155 RepID=C5FHZ8_ARTOC|nr:bZIP transcription factor HapX [Microsporum canis CBS 113480]EEQ28978.1 bZIP transcription factor HapX [Microsporum canis CBS 113480]